MIDISGRKIGPGEPLFIVAEVGATSNGSAETVLTLVEAAKAAGADAIKFMFIRPDEFMADKTVQYEYDWAGGRTRENMYQMFRGLMLPESDWRRITEHCRLVGLPWYATVDNLPDVDMAERLGCPAYKLSSWDIRHYPLIRRMARTGKPLQIDLGPALLGEVCQVLDEIDRTGRHQQVIVVHCTHSNDPADFNLNTIPYLRYTLELPVGWSADSRDDYPDLVAVGLGANLVEKRLTMARTYPGHHHVKALEPDEFAEWVGRVRLMERGELQIPDPTREAPGFLGEYAVRPSLSDLRMKDLYFTFIHAAQDIPAGAVITEDMLCAKRPGHGISPYYIGWFAGRTCAQDVRANEMWRWDCV